MKKFAIRYAVCLLVMVVALAGMVYGWQDHQARNAIGVLLLWPATLLARHGVAPSWPVAVICLLALPVAGIFCLRSKSAMHAIGATAIVSLLFCAGGAWRARQLTHTKPLTNPYPPGSTSAAAYAEGYGEGYAGALTGTWATCCFRPEDVTRGYYDGEGDGSAIFNRALGLLENKDRNLIRRSAEVDGVRTVIPPR